ncbi:MAG: response regulator, partial [Chloroflexales bacterium]|nr:response regulator [Chloroflexales bacterium]
SLPDSQGLSTFTSVHTAAPAVPVVVLTGLADETVALQALQAGAQDYIVKSQVEGDSLVRALRYAIERQRLRDQLERATQDLSKERTLLALRVAERTADLRRANAELARAARLKDEFLANMSHELRTPLGAILGFAEVLSEQIHGPLSPKQLDTVRSITTSGQHLLAMITDILDLSKVEVGTLTIERTGIEIALVGQAAVQMVVQSAYKKQLKLTTAYDPQVEVIVADERRLKQILVNLLSNAVKFTPAGGTVGLEVRGDPEAQTVTFTVSDTGIGISAEDQAQLFQPFVQLDSALNRQYEGTGLGLALVLRLAELHGGSVALESQPGQGSRFQITLPWVVPRTDGGEPLLAAAPASHLTALDQPPAQTPGAAAPPRILLAEDSEENIRVLRDYLSAHGYEVTVARNGIEAVAEVEAQRPDAILMDIQMPVMDGLEATHRLREAGLERVPIIALTALAMAGDRERCLAAGADDYLPKPVQLRTLLETIERHRQRRMGRADEREVSD